MALRSRRLGAALCSASSVVFYSASSSSESSAKLQVFDLAQIKGKIPSPSTLLRTLEDGFVSYSQGDVQVAAGLQLNTIFLGSVSL
jgi:hypothetical protein